MNKIDIVKRYGDIELTLDSVINNKVCYISDNKEYKLCGLLLLDITYHKKMQLKELYKNLNICAFYKKQMVETYIKESS